ncbi:MAG TPA: PaaI family thioesterase [Acidimicrobiales bacterium]|nr:PaaI family thioesterase [Acidimicrobiales bacterium]
MPEAEGSPPGRPRLRIPPPCDELLGLVCIDKSTPGTTVWEMPAVDALANPAGAVQGGLVAALADTAMSASAVTANRDRRLHVANTDLRISFIRPARIPGVLTCTATVVSSGRRVAFVEARVVDAAGALVATASSTYLLSERA